MAKTYRIHPAIGIARIGNSTERFVGPEAPGIPARPDEGRFRDASGRVKRQAARFRVYEYDDAQPDAEPKELTADSPDVHQIVWTVHLANKKAAWFNFDGPLGEGPEGYPPGAPLRNRTITDPAERQRKLIIDPGPRTVTGRNQSVEFERGQGGDFPETFPGPLAGGVEITSLGSLFTDDKGRLEVAGGFGTSGTTGQLPANGDLDFANNDGWFDDTADGLVTVNVVRSDGSAPPVSPAWVLVGPPDFAPPIENVVTMYDVLYDLGLRHFKLNPALFDAAATPSFRPDYVPSFTDEIYPILRRAIGYRWVNQRVFAHHSTLMDFVNLGKAPTATSDPHRLSRRRIFQMLRDPDHPGNPDALGMPMLFGDRNEGFNLTLTRTQYFLMRQWMHGRFQGDWQGEPTPTGRITAASLDRAALEGCAGGAFYPGIEAGWIMRDPRIYQEAFRIAPHSDAAPNGLEPGDVTKRSALPWQADFLACGDFWWPAQRPNQVRVSTASSTMLPWDRGIDTSVQMVEEWHQLGFVKSDPGGQLVFFEDERRMPEL